MRLRPPPDAHGAETHRAGESGAQSPSEEPGSRGSAAVRRVSGNTFRIPAAPTARWRQCRLPMQPREQPRKCGRVELGFGLSSWVIVILTGQNIMYRLHFVN